MGGKKRLPNSSLKQRAQQQIGERRREREVGKFPINAKAEKKRAPKKPTSAHYPQGKRGKEQKNKNCLKPIENAGKRERSENKKSSAHVSLRKEKRRSKPAAITASTPQGKKGHSRKQRYRLKPREKKKKEKQVKKKCPVHCKERRSLTVTEKERRQTKREHMKNEAS